MKYIKYVSLLFFVTSLSIAKQIGTGTTPVQTVSERIIPQPIQPVQEIKPIFTQPTIPSFAQQSYADALNVIKNQMSDDQVLHNNQFTPYFVNFVKENASNEIFARALFEAGGYLYAPFKNEDVINRTIISDIKDAIDRQLIIFSSTTVEPIIKKTESMKAGMYSVPTDLTTLRKLDLYPLFGQKGGLYFIFNPKARKSSGEIVARFEGEEVAQNAPCIVQLDKFGAWNRTLMQLKTLDQLNPIISSKFSAAMCAGLSLNNGRLIRKYALEGKTEYLLQLHDMNEATHFLRNFKIGDWLNAAVVRTNIKNLKNELGIEGVDASAISTVSLFDANLDKKFGFGIFDQDEFAYVQKVKKNIQEGLKRDNYIHIMIIGNEEIVEEALGHYFCFAIIKVGNQLQYIVLDTIPSAYHLQEGSHERDRLMFVIDNIEQNGSAIKVENIRIKRLQMLEEERLKSLKK